MDSMAVMQSQGTALLDLEYLSTNGWTAVRKSFYVVNNTALGPVVLGNDFASLYCQGMSWDEYGQISVGAHGCVHASGEEVSVPAYGLPNLPGVKVYEYPSGRVKIVSSDFFLWREPGQTQFICRWIWKHGQAPEPFSVANRGDYNPKLTEKEEEELGAEVEKLIKNGWVEEFDGDVHNILPWVLVPQPHKTTALRMCLDFRLLNKHLVNDPIRDMVNCVDTLHKWRSVTKGYTLDVTKCYYMVRMCPSLYKYMVVMINRRLYCMKVLPFGACFAPKAVTAVITWLLKDVPYPVSSFIDDVIVEDPSGGDVPVDERGQLKMDPPAVTAVREALAKGNMFCKPAQIIGAPDSRVLGLDLHVQDGIVKWSRRKDQALDIDLRGPPTKRELARWCGRVGGHVPIAGWLRPHIANLLRIVGSAAWDEELDECTMDLVWYIAEKLSAERDPACGVWFCPSPSGKDPIRWLVYADASGAAMGAVLAYSLPDGTPTVVRDASWLLDRRALLRHINVNELCAAAKALSWAAPFIGGHVELYVDNQCVQVWISKFMRGEAVKKGGLSSTIVGRRLQSIYDISETFADFSVHYVETAANLADPLSRVDASFTELLEVCHDPQEYTIDVDTDIACKDNVVAAVGGALTAKLIGEDLVLNLGVVVEAQYDDELLFRMRRAIQRNRPLPEGVPVELQQLLPTVEIDEMDVLVRRYYAAYQGKEVVVPILPGQLVAELVHSVHGVLCHAGLRRTLQEMTGMVWFHKICDVVMEMLQSCDICVRKTRPLLVKHDIGLFSPKILSTALPWSIVCADVVYLPPGIPYLSQQCVVSKFACLFELPGEDATTIAAAFEEVWRVLGKRPQYLLTDNGAAFLSCKLQQVTRLFTAPYSSPSNGMIESLHRTVRLWMRSVMADDPTLSPKDAVHKVMRAYNSTVHSVTHRIPVELFKLEPMTKPDDRVEWDRVINNCVKLAEQKLQHSTKHELFPGAIVRLRDVDSALRKPEQPPYAERRWRLIGFLSSDGLITHINSGDYGLFRKAKIVYEKEVKIVHVPRLVRCFPAEVDVEDLRRAMRRIRRDDY